VQQQMKIGQLKLLPLPTFLPTCLTDAAAPKAGMSDPLVNQVLTHPTFQPDILRLPDIKVGLPPAGGASSHGQ